MGDYYCRDCGQRLDVVETSVGPNDVQMLWTSRLTGKWQCTARDGLEHVSQSGVNHAERMIRSITGVKNLVEAGDLAAEQGLRVICMDAGLIDPPSGFIDALTWAKAASTPPG